MVIEMGIGFGLNFERGGRQRKCQISLNIDRALFSFQTVTPRFLLMEVFFMIDSPWN
jgi:hypothetical protein